MEELRAIQNDGQNRRREGGEREGCADHAGRESRAIGRGNRVDGLEWLDVLANAAEYLGVHDVDLIMSWTPNEYKAFLKGAQMKMVSDYENLAIQAMYIRKADNEKRLKLTDLFDADKARKRILEGDKDWKESKKMDTTLYKKAQADMKAWAEKLNMKG